LCGSSPRVAHVVGENLKNNPDDIFKTPSTAEVWDRFIAGGDSLDSPKVAERRIVLQHIALFKRFGYGPPLKEEAKTISKIIKGAHAQIGWGKFQEIVSELRARKLLQGGTTLYISPKLLHIKLWSEWWGIYGSNFDLDEFALQLPAQTMLLDWFREMFEYAQESQAASNLVKRLLGPGGPFKNIAVFEAKRAAFFFRALAGANPAEALKCLQRTVGGCNKEQLLKFRNGRREVIYALEHIVFYKEMFLDGARLLLKLAEAENETWGNNASGVFADLFSPGYGATAPTSASPIERLPVLIEALNSDSQEIRKLALNSCDHALEAVHFTRFGGHEYAGLKKAPDGWTPETNSEWWEGYRKVWKLLEERLATFQESDRVTAVSIMLGRTRGLLRRTNLEDRVIPTLEDIVAKGYSNKKEVIKRLVEIIHYDGKVLPKELLTTLEQFKEKLEGTGFSSQLQRYVGMDLLEDDYDDSGERVDRTRQIIRELAKQALGNTEQFHSELDWLVTTEAKNGLLFGYELGLADTGFQLLPDLLEAQRNAQKNPSPFFLCGYFRALFERDKSQWEKELDGAAQDAILRALVPELTWRSGPLTDRAALRVLKLIEEGILGYEHFRMFSYGSVIREITDDVFRKWFDLLIQNDEQDAIAIALDLHNFFYCRKESKYELPEERTFKLLTHPTFFTKSTNRREPMGEYYWSATGKLFVKKYPEKSLELADLMLEHFYQQGTIIDDTYGSPIEVLNAIVQRFPEQAWELIKNYLGPPIDARAYHITHWLRGDEHSRPKGGVLELIPPKKLWEWVDENVLERAHSLTNMVPKALFREEGRFCLAREVLVRYGDQADVRNSLMANFSTEGWKGPESSHLEGKKQWLMEFKAGERNKNVRRWIDEYLAVLDESIQRAQIAEEREAF